MFLFVLGSFVFEYGKNLDKYFTSLLLQQQVLNSLCWIPLFMIVVSLCIKPLFFTCFYMIITYGVWLLWLQKWHTSTQALIVSATSKYGLDLTVSYSNIMVYLTRNGFPVIHSCQCDPLGHPYLR
ncbi:hypothetical protein K501DRAFT_273139 [Backusella circina FSU 941]|nr:hypothetical protein K501DRAFT_273139 [Backusella circina FSU 941]